MIVREINKNRVGEISFFKLLYELLLNLKLKVFIEYNIPPDIDPCAIKTYAGVFKFV